MNKAVFHCAALIAGVMMSPFSQNVQAKPEPLSYPHVIEQALPMSRPTDRRIPLIFHRMSSCPPTVVSRNQNYMFKDETLLPPETSLREELMWMRRAGAAAICQEDGIETLMKTVRGTGLKVVLLLNMAPMRLASYKASISDPDSVIRYFTHMLEYGKRWPNSVFRIDNRPMIWLFAATTAPADYYPRIRDGIRAAGYDPVILYHAQYKSDHNQPRHIEPYLREFDGIFVLGGGYRAIRKITDMAIPIRDKLEKELGEKRRVMLTAQPGYWRPEKGIFIDKHGTEELRRILDLGYHHNVDGLNIESWNDYSEMHHVQPSMLNSTALTDLMMYYGRLGLGEVTQFEFPALYVSHAQGLVRGEVFSLELLALPLDKPETRRVRLLLHDQAGNEVYRSGIRHFERNEAKTVTFKIATAELTSVDTLVPSLEINAVPMTTRTFCSLDAARSARPNTIHMNMAKSWPSLSCEFSLDGHQPGATYVSSSPRRAGIAIRGKVNVDRIEIIKNDLPIYSVNWEKAMRETAGGDHCQIAGFYWDIPGPVPGQNQDFAGRIRVENGEVLEAVHIKQSRPARKSESLVAWGQGGPLRRQHDAVEVIFTGGDNTIFEVDMPGQRKPFQVKWSQIAEHGSQEYPLQSHSRLRVKQMPAFNGHTSPLGIDHYSGETQLPTLNDQPRNVYYLRVVAEDQSIYRSQPIHVLTEAPQAPREVFLWDQALQKPLRTTVASHEIIDLAWDFDEAQKRIIPDRRHRGFAWELGGKFLRDGRYSPDQVPRCVKGRKGLALRFDGNDIAINSPQLIPLGAWAMEMWIKPEDLARRTRQVILKTPETLQICIEPDRRLRLWFGDRMSHVNLAGTTQLERSRWYRLNFAYNLERVVLSLDGKHEIRANWKGYRDRIAQQTCLGANLSARHMQPPYQGFRGLIDEFHLTNCAQTIAETIGD